MREPTRAENRYTVYNGHVSELTARINRFDSIDTPTLFVGLGGLGIEAMLNIKREVQRCFTRPEGKVLPERIAFLAVDCDSETLHSAHVGSTYISAREYCELKIPHGHAAMNGSAGGDREKGRTALKSDTGLFLQKILNVYEHLYSSVSAEDAPVDIGKHMDVYVLTGICGGFGSGSFLDAAYILKNYIAENLSHRNVYVHGIILMPDMILGRVTNPIARQYLMANAYAAMTEMDHWMNPNRGRNFKESYFASVYVDTKDAPFSTCYLISRADEDDVRGERALQTLGRAMVQILTATIGTSITFQSMICNAPAMNVFRRLVGNYPYATLGQERRDINIDIPIACFGTMLFKKINDGAKARPDREVVSEYLKVHELDRDGVLGIFALQSDHPANIDEFLTTVANLDPSEVLSNEKLEDQLAAWVSDLAAQYAGCGPDFVKSVGAAISDTYFGYFCDLKTRGPFCAKHFLKSDDPDVLSLVGHLTALFEEFNAVLSTQDEDREALELKVRAAKAAALAVPIVPGLVTLTQYNEYLAAAWDLFEFNNRIELYSCAADILDEIISFVADLDRSFAEPICDRLVEYYTLFKRSYTGLSNGSDDTASGALVPPSAMIDHVSNQIRAQENKGLFDRTVANFLHTLISSDERDAWADAHCDMTESIIDYITTEFDPYLFTQTPEMIALEAKHFGDLMMFQNDIADTFEAMTKNVQLCFHADERTYILNRYPALIEYATYPDKSPFIGMPMQRCTHERNLSRITAVPTGNRCSIDHLKVAVGLPLYAYADIKACAEAYDKMGALDRHEGRHLFGLDPADPADRLPCILPEFVMDKIGYRNDAVLDMNRKAMAIFDSAIELKLITPDPRGWSPSCCPVCDNDEYNAIMQSSILSAEEIKALIEQGASAANRITTDPARIAEYSARARAFLDNGWQPDPSKRLCNIPFGITADGTPTESLIKYEGNTPDHTEQIKAFQRECLTLTPAYAESIRIEVEKKRALQALVQAYDIFADALKTTQDPTDYREFAQAIYYQLYTPVGADGAYCLNTKGFQLAAFALMQPEDYAAVENADADKYLAIYRKFKTLDENQRSIIHRLIEISYEALIDEVNCGIEELWQRYYDKAAPIRDEIFARSEDLIEIKSTLDNECIAFYDFVLAELNRLLAC